MDDSYYVDHRRCEVVSFLVIYFPSLDSMSGRINLLIMIINKMEGTSRIKAVIEALIFGEPTKKVPVNSSNDSKKTKIQLAINPGAACGKTIWKKV